MCATQHGCLQPKSRSLQQQSQLAVEQPFWPPELFNLPNPVSKAQTHTHTPHQARLPMTHLGTIVIVPSVQGGRGKFSPVPPASRGSHIVDPSLLEQSPHSAPLLHCLPRNSIDSGSSCPLSVACSVRDQRLSWPGGSCWELCGLSSQAGPGKYGILPRSGSACREHSALMNESTLTPSPTPHTHSPCRAS